MKLKALCNEWLEYYQKDHVKIQTYVRYKCAIDNYINGSIGEVELRKIDKRFMQEYVIWLKNYQSARTGKKLSASTINMCLIILKMVFDYAVDFKIVKTNPTQNVRGISVKRVRQVKCFTLVEQEKIERYIEDKHNDEWFGIILDLYTGLRIGELLALTWDDINFKTGVMSVNKTVYVTLDENGNWHTETGAPKTATSNREIPLPEHILSSLKTLKSKSNGKNVISRLDGSAISPRLYRWRYNKMLQELNIRHLSFHTLRHTFATRAIESGMDAKTLSEILGHSGASITLNVYTHSLTAYKRQMMNGIKRII